MLSRTEGLCRKIRQGKGFNRRKGFYKGYKLTGKELQKNLVLIDYQGEEATEVAPLREYEKIYDGCMRFKSDMKESDIREEICRLVSMKESITHSLGALSPSDFDFVRCANRRVRAIDGDTPFDASGISQVYKNGAIYVRLNTPSLECYYDVSLKHFIIGDLG